MNLKSYLYLLSSAITFHATAQVTEQFNSRSGIARTEVRNYLQASCWNFSSFISSLPDEVIEGDGSLTSVPPVNASIPSGIYSPLLDINSTFNLKFKYRATKQYTGSLVKIYLANAGNEQQLLLDSITLDKDQNTTLNYNRQFTGTPTGIYKLFIQYNPKYSDSRLTVDDILIDAGMHYPGGCNRSPVAKEDMVFLDESGVSKTALTTNDRDADNDQFKPYIEKGSRDGIIKLNADNSFAFTPNPGFKGNSTEFTYRVCETGPNGLCSESAKVIVKLPTSVVKTELTDFTGEYKQAGNIDLHWSTRKGHTNRQFEIERSLDGKSWELAGTVAANASTQYVFNDHVNKNIANKNDILYRLKEIKVNDASLTSKLLIVRVYNSPGVRMVSVSPNPARNDINVTLQLNKPSITSMKVLTSNGDEVFRKTVKTADEVNNILLEGSSELQPGEYTLDVIINSKERMLVRLLKD